MTRAQILQHPKLRLEQTVREQIIIVDIDLKRSRQMRQRRFADSFIIT